MNLTMAYSPCPNDTFMFQDVAAGQLARHGYDVAVHLYDVETLNRKALEGAFDVTKISFHAYLLVRQHYQLLNCGAALGFGCGPLVVARAPLQHADMARVRVAVPGELTTAHLLFRLWAPAAQQKIFLPYDQILEAVCSGAVDCGVLIHETRFIYQQSGLICLADLGQWWEAQTQQPIPLGCIVARKTLGATVIADLEKLLRQAIVHSRAQPGGTMAYVRQHAQETDEKVLRQHIQMFVTDFSVDLGERGHAAIAVLERMARAAGVIS
ncbi:MAG: 1,4-dihydroxy-6-naphthoate synthase [Verrucomicrobia bacterium]|nr:MAG: 1,4-dihydroxy-6-naphthoate synthase [Verrucomicrobiota bacterium]